MLKFSGLSDIYQVTRLAPAAKQDRHQCSMRFRKLYFYLLSDAGIRLPLAALTKGNGLVTIYR